MYIHKFIIFLLSLIVLHYECLFPISRTLVILHMQLDKPFSITGIKPNHLEEVSANRNQCIILSIDRYTIFATYIIYTSSAIYILVRVQNPAPKFAWISKNNAILPRSCIQVWIKLTLI